MLNALTELHEWLFFHHRAKAIEFTTTEGEGEIFLGFFFWRLKKSLQHWPLSFTLMLCLIPCCFL